MVSTKGLMIVLMVRFIGDKASQKVMQEKAQKMAAPDAAVQIATWVLSLAA